MKPAQFRDMTKEELDSKQISLKEELMNLRFKAKMGKLDKPSRINAIKKDIARILTILKEDNYAKSVTSKKA